MAYSPTFSDPTAEPLLVLIRVGAAFRESCAPKDVVITSLKDIPEIDVLPVFETVIVYVTISPISVLLLAVSYTHLTLPTKRIV